MSGDDGLDALLDGTLDDRLVIRPCRRVGAQRARDVSIFGRMVVHERGSAPAKDRTPGDHTRGAYGS